jgi:hypothetical protein
MQRKLFSFHGNHLDSELRCILRHIHDLIYFPQGKSFIFNDEGFQKDSHSLVTRLGFGEGFNDYQML